MSVKGEKLFYHQNTLGSVFALTNAGGDLVELYQYDAYGRQTVFDSFGQPILGGVSEVGNPFLFVGRRLDAETLLIYNRARYLDVVQGRFVGRDPIGFSTGDGTLYEYVANNSANVTDPTGEQQLTKQDHVRIIRQIDGTIKWIRIDKEMRAQERQQYLKALETVRQSLVGTKPNVVIRLKMVFAPATLVTPTINKTVKITFPQVGGLAKKRMLLFYDGRQIYGGKVQKQYELTVRRNLKPFNPNQIRGNAADPANLGYRVNAWIFDERGRLWATSWGWIAVVPGQR
ncbi:MAG: hypothetical protein KatS3mg105_2864 [Gemmatales bacterium]|nr:MAG: hypothetical protein KatS3mg105_2864 [Gemmatales bacterium]